MSIREAPIIVFRCCKTGKDINNFLIQTPIPRIRECVVTENNKIYRVKDIVTHSYWSKTRKINTEVRIYVEKEK